MKRFLLLLLCLSALPCHAENNETIRVLTFNLRYFNVLDSGAKTWTQRRETAAEIIKNDAADFVGVQEAFRMMLDDLKARVPGYGELGVGRDDGKKKGEYSAILYREAAWEPVASGNFWLSDTPEVVASSTWGNNVTRICTWGRFKNKKSGRELFVFNTHFDHESQPSREKAAALIRQRIRDRGSKAPVILMGDFNAAPDNPAIITLTKGPPSLTDAWLTVNKDTPRAEAGTFHGFGGKRDGARIDYVFMTEELKPVESSILHNEKGGNYPSDHYPVRATLRLP